MEGSYSIKILIEVRHWPRSKISVLESLFGGYGGFRGSDRSNLINDDNMGYIVGDVMGHLISNHDKCI